MSFKKIIKYIVTAVLAVSAAIPASACRGESSSSKGTDFVFGTVIEGSPSTLDPQTSVSDSAVNIIPNIFQGLYRVADGGDVVPAMAEEVTVSDDGLVWEFRLREDVKWYCKDGFTADCTAEDFVFGFRRLVNPALRSTRAKEYYCIKNAEEINTGKLNDLSELGVEAPEKYKLRITLDEPRSDFRYLLSAPPAMPCNEEYYLHTEGQYGLVADCVGSNGDFYVSRWHYDKWTKSGNFIEIRRNPVNSESSFVSPQGVNYYINEDGYEYFRNGNIQNYCTADSEQIIHLSGKYGHSTYSTAVWGLMFNNSGIFDSYDLRIALGGYAKGTVVGDVYSPADRIVPDGITIDGEDYRALAGTPGQMSYTDTELSERGERAMYGAEAGALSGLRFIIPESCGLKQELGNMLQEWQKRFGIYCMLTDLPADEYLSALSSGNYDIALFRSGGGGSGALSYLETFTSSSSGNYARVKSRKLDNIIKSAVNTSDSASAAKYCLEAEQLIMDNCWFVPMFFENEHVFRANGVSGVEYDPFKGVFTYKNALNTQR